MSEKPLLYDYSYLLAETIGSHGLTSEDLTQLQPQLEAAHQDYLYAKDQQKLGYSLLPTDLAMLQQVKALAKEVRQQFSHLVVLGIGGSDLGARALQAALNHTYYNQLPNQTHRLYFAGANTDPRQLADLIDLLDFSQTALFVVSKSGQTIETMSAFVYLREKLLESLEPEEVAQHIIVATDPEEGSLRQIATQQGYRSLPIPSDVGGRFSVLSAVGLFPAAYVNIDIEQLAQGAADFDQAVVATPVKQNPALLYAAHQYLANTQHQQSLSVLMPYAEGLRPFAQWYRQLWAESLGKAVNSAGRTINTGPTPIAALGATDQHSQLQLYNEGPYDKIVTFITVEESSRSLTLDQSDSPLEPLQYLQGLELNEILLSEAQATAMALAKNGRPNATIRLERLDEYTLGQLIYFFQLATTYSGYLYQIDPYNQPGVESGKRAIYGLIGRPGYQSELDSFKDLLAQQNKHIA